MSKNNIKEYIRKKIESRVIFDQAEYSFQPASDLIRQNLISNKPCMIARIGSSELACISEYRKSRNKLSIQPERIETKKKSISFSSHTKYRIFNYSGLFPLTDEILSKFCELMIEDIKQVDILGTWLSSESYFNKELENAKKVRMPDIEPYYHHDPWTTALSGRKVLVIHPFAKTIKEQYKKRKLLFSNENILPAFELKTIKAVQSLAGEQTRFKNWFEALDDMKNKINKIPFDIAIIGCGAYGLPLAAHVKRIGRKSVHLGGATQILFGIIGKRWEEEQKFISTLFNQHWVRPSLEEMPKNWTRVENGCYW